jgi:hypothetical protein
VTRWDDDEDDTPRISNAEKRRLHLKRVEAVERRKKQRNGRHHIKPVDHYEYCPGLKSSEGTDFDQEIEEDEPTFIQVEAIIALLRSIERHRQALRDNETTLRKWLRASSEFTNAWNVFVNAGGVSAADFDNFMDGQFHARRIRRKKHLRLVASR